MSSAACVRQITGCFRVAATWRFPQPPLLRTCWAVLAALCLATSCWALAGTAPDTWNPRRHRKAAEGLRKTDSGSRLSDSSPFIDGRHAEQDYSFSGSEWYQKLVSEGARAMPLSSHTAPTCGLLPRDWEPVHGSWYRDVLGHFQFEPHQCRLRRLTGQQARQCLAHRHIVFIGDSITRYQYTSLVDFLGKKKFMARYGHAKVQSLACEKEWLGGWDDFFVNGSLAIQQAVGAHATETCDCFHRPAAEVHNRSREIREFTLSGFDADVPHGGRAQSATLRVSYYQVLDNPTFADAGINAINKVLKELPERQIPADVVIMNMGIWFYNQNAANDPEPIFRSIFRAARDAPDPKPTFFWKPTTATINPGEVHYSGLNQHSLRMCQEEGGWKLHDVHAVSQSAKDQGLSFYWDSFHFIAAMYEQFNDLLLNTLCKVDHQFAY
ncbi:hypothetical protein WJX72_000368 [[Myrmecia] bisecta]|uniref:Uncharacterized protein n=1 Tax=[Myrmecia] bisecta TaxID=41462 RepID=A0AAW1PWD0_9CHLO